MSRWPTPAPRQDRGGFDRALARERSKDSTLDYARGFALRREIMPPQDPTRCCASG